MLFQPRPVRNRPGLGGDLGLGPSFQEDAPKCFPESAAVSGSDRRFRGLDLVPGDTENPRGCLAGMGPPGSGLEGQVDEGSPGNDG